MSQSCLTTAPISEDIALTAPPITISACPIIALSDAERYARRHVKSTPEFALSVSECRNNLDSGTSLTMYMVAVNPDSTDMSVPAFRTFTQGLHDLADWFRTCGVTSVAMDSTGAYGIPAFEILEQHGCDVILVNARHAKNVPGRKTDVSVAGWLWQSLAPYDACVSILAVPG